MRRRPGRRPANPGGQRPDGRQLTLQAGDPRRGRDRVALAGQLADPGSPLQLPAAITAVPGG
jgi:hypothetical protein